jgi:hypothetical protein
LPRAAAIEHDGSGDIDALLASVVQAQRLLGRRVCGLLMTYPEGRDSCAGPMVLVDIDKGDAYPVSQPLGRDSRACRADTQGFAHAGRVLRAALAEAPDLVIINRFGSLEAEGGGFAAELLELMSSGVPVLTAVATRHAAAWTLFSGGAPLLPARAEAVNAWIAATLTPRSVAA